jgi:hypothetical protein
VGDRRPRSYTTEVGEGVHATVREEKLWRCLGFSSSVGSHEGVAVPRQALCSLHARTASLGSASVRTPLTASN